MKKLKQAHGNWVIGDRFWNREHETELFEKHIRDGAHLLLVAQRRMGKTSLMKEAARRLANDYHCIFVDFQNSSNAKDAISQLTVALHPHFSLWKKAQGIFENILSKVDKVNIDELSINLRAGLTEGNWSSKGDALLRMLANEDKPVLLLMDEVPILVNRIIKGNDYEITPKRRQAASEFMTWLRKNSLEHQGKIHMVVTGSIGFEPVLRQADLSASINNFVPFELKPWDKKTAIGCLNALASEYNITYADSADATMTDLLGCCIPHHVQMFFDHAYTYCVRHKTTELTPADVADIYRSEMLSTRGHAELTHYEERLKLVLGTDKINLAIEMLTEAAVADTLRSDAIRKIQQDYSFEDETTAEVQREILWILEHDGYLEQTTDGYQFISKLLKEWWDGRYRVFFTPIMEREV